MSSFFQSGEHLEQGLAPEPFARPAAGAVLLHCGLVVAIVFTASSADSSITICGEAQAPAEPSRSTSPAPFPFPSDHPPNQNVLATEKPSEAPAPPEPKAKQEEDETAIPILGKTKKPRAAGDHSKLRRQPQPVPQNRAQYGEQAGLGYAAHMAQSGVANGPTTLTDANFGSLFGWYVDNINRKMDANGYRSLADPRTPKGARLHRVHDPRDGSHERCAPRSHQRQPTWDTACVRAAQRVDTFGPLPPGYRDSYLQVYFDCTY